MRSLATNSPAATGRALDAQKIMQKNSSSAIVRRRYRKWRAERNKSISLWIRAELECIGCQIVAVSFEAFARDPGIGKILVEGIVFCWYFHQAGL
ncbi:unnamed protein product [Oikopleura dioica]|uniref:Uncharacterized protein n=1 Tax=Oikopleura dioica TaxID=34765 RepID=E4WU04_OIKDI|nr:unnamed protein product [Oikopleura dioica]